MTTVAILLSTYNGARFLPEQLDSLAAQTHREWVLYWRDDGSTDASPHLVRAFIARLAPGRAVTLDDPGRFGATESFLRLLRTATAAGHELTGFADQDDVWLPDKLAFAAQTLQPYTEPALYFARQQLVDAALRPLGLSPIRRPGFPAALTQNVATGCTVVLNGAAARLVAGSRAPAAANHDWWSYLIAAGAGARLIHDDRPVVLYRQHGANVVGAPVSPVHRGLAALHRGPSAFMNVMRQNVFALADQGHLLTPDARRQVDTLARALRSNAFTRMKVLAMPGLVRQTWLETLIFRLWFVLG